MVTDERRRTAPVSIDSAASSAWPQVTNAGAEVDAHGHHALARYCSARRCWHGCGGNGGAQYSSRWASGSRTTAQTTARSTIGRTPA